MPTWTVICHRSYDLISPIAAIAGNVPVYGWVRVAVLDAADPDTAMHLATTAKPAPALRPNSKPHAETKWTVIGTVDKGVCPSWSVDAVIPGQHEVTGTYISVLSYRWDTVVTTNNADEAYRAGWDYAGDRFHPAWY